MPAIIAKRLFSFDLVMLKKGGFCILQMLRIHTGLRKWNKEDVYDKHLRKINPIGIDIPCIKIAKSELLFEKYRMALKRDKDAIEFQKDDAINRNQFFFKFHAKNVQSSNSIIC